MSASTFAQISIQLQCGLQRLGMAVAAAAEAHRSRFPVPPGLLGVAVKLVLHTVLPW